MSPALPQQHYPQQQPYMNRIPQPHAPAYRPPPQQIPVQANKRVKIEEEEEDDTFVPRDIAAQRFIRWTEWMEEILSSGYNIRIFIVLQKGFTFRGYITSTRALTWD